MDCQKIGMKFESEDHACRFYNAYTGLVVFLVFGRKIDA